MNINLEDLNEPYRTQARVQLGLASATPDVEQDPCNAPDEAEETARPYRPAYPVMLRYHQVRSRLTDVDGCASKYATDALVEAGLLRDDRPQEVSDVEYSQEQGNFERTVIEIWE